jgi:hypothetical protein
VRAVLVRVGIDQACGAWNGPVDPITREFTYVPIPEREQRPGYETVYASIQPALARFAAARVVDERACVLPEPLLAKSTHLDPDFSYLTYGDNGTRRGKAIGTFKRGDIVVFYAGLRPCRPVTNATGKLTYALIGLYHIDEVVSLDSVEQARWNENAHTRRQKTSGSDIIVRALRGKSGRLRRCFPIADFRDGAYRVTRDLLVAWGELSCRDGFIQRSAVPPMFLAPEKFLAWFAGQDVELVADNNP